MRIGLVSDTHGRADRLRKAIDLLGTRRVDVLVHCGDVGSPACVEVLASTGCNVYLVAGNMDRRPDELQAAAEKLALNFACEVVEVPLGDGGRLAATHGDDAELLGQLIASGQYRYVCHGHTHRRRDERIGRVRVINPGAIARTRLPSAAVLVTETDTVEYVAVD
ncbi:MAG: YfcE family phosphodiesterase [Planctomycetes bacterium]|nr:YfcE family phosphodiesterase [Planctomycetota bacterium]